MEAEHKNKILWHIAQYVRLSPKEEEILLSNLSIKTYKKNELILKLGEIHKFNCFILKGGARMFHLDDEGTEHIVQFAIENWWIGDLGSFITQSPADYSIQCFEDTELIQLSYKNLQLLYDAVPIMERYYRIIIQNAYVNAQKRIVNKTMLSAAVRYTNFRKKYPEIEQRVPQYMIASYLGITKEFLSKIRRQLASS